MLMIGFLNDELTQDTVIRNLEIVGEASSNIGKHFPKFIEADSDVPFSSAYEMRNALAHGYLKLIWKLSGKQLSGIYPSSRTESARFSRK